VSAANGIFTRAGIVLVHFNGNGVAGSDGAGCGSGFGACVAWDD
jgi:hypothetical protein